MTISSTVRIAGPYIGSGAATVFPFAFKVFAAAEMQVAKLNTTSNVETILVLNTDYTVTLNGDQNGTPGGTITLPAVLASGYNLTITSDIANLQPTDLTNQGGFYPEVITDALDRATIQIQQLDQNSRAIKIPLSDGVLDMTTPVVSARQGKYLAFDTFGLPVVSSGTGSDSALRTDLANATAVSAGSRLSGFRQDGTGATARTVDAKLKDTLSVKDFGAVGDGVTDDTAAIQAAITALGNNNSGILEFLPGVYSITDEIVLPSLTNCEICGSGDYGAASPPPRTNALTIIWNGVASPNKAMFRAPAGSGNKTKVSGIAFDGGQNVGYCFKIEGVALSTVSNTWQFYSCHFTGASKVGVMVGTFDLSIDIDSYQTNFWECLFDKCAICIYANAQNNYGPSVERCYFADSTQIGSPGYTINYIRTKKSGDFRIYNSFFGPLAPASTVIDPETGLAVVDSDIFCVYVEGAGTISDCLTEDPRILKTLPSSSQSQGCLIANIIVNNSASADDRGRNLNWSLGTAAYSIYNSSSLEISNCQLGGSSGGLNANAYRKMYNDSVLAIDNSSQSNQFLGVYGQIVHGANSNITKVNGANPNTILVSPNWALSHWQDNNLLLDNVLKFNGATAVSTVTRSTLNTIYSVYSAAIVTTVAATTYVSGLEITGTSLPNSKYVTLIVTGYCAAGLPALKVYKTSGTMTPLNTTDGNLFIFFNSTTNMFIAKISYSIDNKINTIPYGAYVGITGTGTVYYNTAFFINGIWELPEISAILPFLGCNDLSTNGKNSTHYGTAAPTVGTWFAGDIVWRSNPAALATPGYVCTVAGTPGTWNAMANLA